MRKYTTVKVSEFTRDLLNKLKSQHGCRSVDDMLKKWIQEKSK